MTWIPLPQLKQLHQALGLTDLEIWFAGFSDESKTQPKETRLLAREFLYQKWRDEFSSLSDVLNLEKRPQPKSKFVSITHCPGLIAVAVSSIPCGLDIEIASRVKEPIARRVSFPGELEAAPSPAHLWVAKEALFKAVPSAYQPTTISEIETRDWQSLGKEDWIFSGHSQQNSPLGTGYSFSLGKDKLGALALWAQG